MVPAMTTQRTALITGGAKRVGRAIVERLAKAGMTVAFTYNTSVNDAEALAKSVGGIAIKADLTDLDQTDVELSRRLMAIHFESPMLLCRQFAPLLRNAHGHVINMVDVMVEKPMPQYLAYCASKAALWNLTLCLARELAPEVTVNGIAPGVVEWPADLPQKEREKYLSRVPLGRAGTPTDVAETVLFLATTGSYISGQIIRLDGGRSIA
jgi:pteridine reductase